MAQQFLSIVLFIAILSLLFNHIQCVEIICEGSIKPSNYIKDLYKGDIDLDYDSVKVSIVNKEGHTKEWTYCAKSGYFMLPIYEHQGQDYWIVVEGPKGWSFEPNRLKVPQEVEDNVIPVDFVFSGFQLKGKVNSINSDGTPNNNGVKGYTVYLKETDQYVMTTKEGEFNFESLLPGTYNLHHGWNKQSISKKSQTVALTSSSTDTVNIVVKEFNVKAQIGEESNIVFYLKSRLKVTEPLGCTPSDKSGYVCKATSKNGVIEFTGIPSGQYEMVHLQDSALQIAPNSLNFKVDSNPVSLGNVFSIIGFQLVGEVRRMKGEAIQNVEIYVNNYKSAISDEEGHYTLNNLKPGQYKITAKHTDYEFKSLNTKIDLTTKLSPILANKVRVCGSVSIHSDSLKQYENADRQYVVKTGSGQIAKEAFDASIQNGKFCFMMPARTHPSKFNIKAIVNKKEEMNGLLLNTYDFELLDEPVNSIAIRQATTKIAGSIECPDCGTVVVVLKPKRSSGKTKKITVQDGGDYEFTNLLPDDYTVSVEADNICWDAASKEVSLLQSYSEHDPTNLIFKRAGTEMQVETKASQVQLSIGKQNVNVPQGRSTLCIPNGIEVVSPKGCYQFEHAIYNVKKGSLISIVPTHHLVQGKLFITHSDEIKLVARENDQHSVNVKLQPSSEGYTFTHWATPESVVTFEIASEDLIIKDNKNAKVIVKANQCVQKNPSIEAERGMIIRGQVKPEIENVTINITIGNIVVATTQTNDQGHYATGPLPKNSYSIIGFKAGYHISVESSKQEEFSIQSILSAKQLGGIHIEVVDVDSKKPLPDAFIRVSNPDGFKFLNQVDTKTGKLSILDLAPNTYYAMPILVEYEFEGARMKEIKVADGEQVHIRFEGKRVAYSCHGSIKSLNGEAYDGITVRAHANSGSNTHFEETISKKDGSFSIKGLKSGQTYRVHIDGGSSLVSTPSQFDKVVMGKEDIHGYDFLVYEQPSFEFVVKGTVDTNIEFIKSLEVQLLVGTHPDTAKVVQSQSLPFNRYFLFNVPQKHNLHYYVRLVSSLNRHLYKVETSPVHVSDDSPMTLYFNPTRVIAEKPLEKSNQFLLIVCVVFFVLFMVRDKLSGFL